MQSAFHNPSNSKATRAILASLKVVGGVSWTLAYRVAISEARDGKQLLPDLAVGFNLSWEAIYSVGGIAKWRQMSIEDRLQTLINVTWFAQDVQLCKTIESPHKLQFAGIGALYQLAFLAIYHPTRAARISALWQNVAISANAALSPMHHATSAEVNFTILRAIGTAIPTLTSGLLRGIEPAYLVPGAVCVAFDMAQVARLRKSVQLHSGRNTV